MHRRTEYVVYPPDYQPGDGYAIRYSRRQAFKRAQRMGRGASVMPVVYWYPAPRTRWTGSSSGPLWVWE